MESVQPLRPYKRPATARQFKPGDPKVLRFFGKWVDTKASKEGTKIRFMMIHSYKAKDVLHQQRVNFPLKLKVNELMCPPIP